MAVNSDDVKAALDRNAMSDEDKHIHELVDSLNAIVNRTPNMNRHLRGRIDQLISAASTPIEEAHKLARI